MSQPWKGIFPIVLTPFKEDGELDEDGLRRMVRFSIEAGARGLVGPANTSEFTTLADGERRRWLEIAIGEAAGRVPVVAAITSGHASPAIELGRFAQELGAGGVMAMPPPILHLDGEGCYSYFEALAVALSIPICIQNFNAPAGTPMSADLLARMCRELPNVEYIKEETAPEPRQVSATLKAAGSDCKGVMGGQGGIYMLDEHRRGAVGNMPGCHTTDVLVDIWNLLDRGEQKQARDRFNQLLPLMMYERLYGVAVYKEVMYRRGVINTTKRRAPGGELDGADRIELDEILKGVEHLFKI